MSDGLDNSTAGASTVATRLDEARKMRWHQQGEALLTFENLRSWMNAAGLVLFVPRPQIVAPAPSLVEAVLGRENAAPTLAETTEARQLLMRLVAEGLAMPLNLLGAGGIGLASETPDFVVSSAVFSYVFTLRGDKLWKQSPVTTGAMKVSHLAVAAFEALGKVGSVSASALALELGGAVTEAAVLRALAELWSHLRVLPITAGEGQPTVWELTTARFTKQIKAGVNAGAPSALSALISLYLGQAAVASEEEIESFLSPLSARSRIREVIRGLLATRQLDTVSVEGRQMLHMAGEEPAFLSDEVTPSTRETEPKDELIAIAASDESNGEATAEDGSRIKKYVPKPRKIGTGYLAKASPVRREGSAREGDRGSARPRPSGDRARPSGDRREGFGAKREGRAPFAARAPRDGAAKRFDKPWSEARPVRGGWKAPSGPRSEVPVSDGAGDVGETPQRRTFSAKPFERKPFERKPFERRERSGEDRAPARGYVKKAGPGAGRDFKPAFKRTFDGPREGAARSPARERTGREGGASFAPRRFDAKPPFKRTFDGSRAGAPRSPARERTGREGGASSAPRRFDAKPAFKRTFDGSRAGALSPARERSGGEGRTSSAPRRFDAKPAFKRTFDGSRAGAPRSSARERTGGEGEAGSAPRRFDARPGFKGAKPGFKRSSGERPTGGAKFGGSKFGSPKPGGSKFGSASKFAGKKTFVGRDDNRLDGDRKFAGAKKSFSKRPPVKGAGGKSRFKPKEDK